MIKNSSDSSFANCAWHGCSAEGIYRAPRSRQNLREYIYFCLEHVRAYNRQWNYFSTMSAAEIEEFQREALFGHRPTQAMGVKNPALAANLRWKMFFGFSDDDKQKQAQQNHAEIIEPLALQTREALQYLGLAWPVTKEEVRRRYKTLVKEHHPDRHGGRGEEKMKEINAAYHQVMVAVADL